MRKKDFIILFFILLTAVIFRLYKINIPLADLHSWRQADTAAVARNFAKNGFDLLHPRFDDLSPNQSAAGLENPEGYRMVEFPLYNAIFAFLYKNFPQLSLEIWGRITSIFFSLIIIALIYYFVLKETNSRMRAVTSSLVYAMFPFFVFFSRVILPETTALSFIFISIFLLYQTVNKSINRLTEFIFYFFSIIFFSLSILIKPTVVFYALVLLYIFYLKEFFLHHSTPYTPNFQLFYILLQKVLYLLSHQKKSSFHLKNNNNKHELLVHLSFDKFHLLQLVKKLFL